MAEQPFGEQSISAVLAALASDQPAPGGGAAGALAAASGAALVAMVCHFSLGRPELAEAQEQIAASLAEADQQRAALLSAMDADAAAFAAVTAAYALPRASKEERAARRRAIDQALVNAAAPPLQVAHASAALAARAQALVGRTNPHLVSDLGSAGALLQAALRIAAFNVEANARLLKDDERAAAMRVELAGVQAEADAALAALAAAVQRAQGSDSDGASRAARVGEGGGGA